MKNKVASIIIGIIVVICIIYVSRILNSPTDKNTNPVSYWNHVITQNFDDEPNLSTSGGKVSSSSAWVVPADPETVRVDSNSLFPINKILLDKQSVADDWKKQPDFKEMLDKWKLEPKYYDFLFNSEEVPESIQDVDVNGGGIKEKIIESIGLGCASCHLSYIDIFANKKVYSTYSNEGGLYPRKDHNGFYITNAFTGDEYATCCPDRYVLSRFEWNGDGFTEVARKTVWITRND